MGTSAGRQSYMSILNSNQKHIKLTLEWIVITKNLVNSIVTKKKNLNKNETWWVLEDIIKFDLRVCGKKRLTLPRIFPKNIYLNLFGGAHIHWKSLRACNIANRTYLSFVLMATFPWSYCWLERQIVRLFRPRSAKNIEYRFTLKRVRDTIIIYSYS